MQWDGQLSFPAVFASVALFIGTLNTLVNLLRYLEEHWRGRNADEKEIHDRLKNLEARADRSEELVTKLHGARDELVDFYKANMRHMKQEHANRLLGEDKDDDASLPHTGKGYTDLMRRYPELAFLVTLFAHLNFSKADQHRAEAIGGRSETLEAPQTPTEDDESAQLQLSIESGNQRVDPVSSSGEGGNTPEPDTPLSKKSEGYREERGWWATVFLKDKLISLWREILREDDYISRLIERRGVAKDKQFIILLQSREGHQLWLRQQAERVFCMCLPAVLAHWFYNLRREGHLWRTEPGQTEAVSHQLDQHIYERLMKEPGYRSIWAFMCALADYSDLREPENFGLFKLKETASDQLNTFFGIDWKPSDEVTAWEGLEPATSSPQAAAWWRRGWLGRAPARSDAKVSIASTTDGIAHQVLILEAAPV